MDSSEEENECECGDSFDKSFDGWLCVNCLEMCANKINVWNDVTREKKDKE